MKKKLIMGVAILSMAIGFVGCTPSDVTDVVSASSQPYITISHAKPIGTDAQLEAYAKYVTYLAEIKRNPDSDIEVVAEPSSPINHFEPLTIAMDYEDIPDDVNFKIDALTDVGMEMYEIYGKEIIPNYSTPYVIECSGELKDGKTYIYYTGFVTTNEGIREDYYKEFVLDFTLEPDIFNFKLDD